MIDAKRKLYQEDATISNNDDTEEIIDTDRLKYMPEDLIGLLNSVKLISFDTISEEKYKDLLENLSYHLHYLEKVIPLLETEEQQKERLSHQDVFTTFSADNQSNPLEEYDFGDDIVWDEQKKYKISNIFNILGIIYNRHSVKNVYID